MVLSFRLRNDLYCIGWSVKLYSLMAKHAYVRDHSGHLSESRPAPGGRRLVDQGANLTFESVVGLP